MGLFLGEILLCFLLRNFGFAFMFRSMIYLKLESGIDEIAAKAHFILLHRHPVISALFVKNDSSFSIDLTWYLG